jgi:hypothetical protein
MGLFSTHPHDVLASQAGLHLADFDVHFGSINGVLLLTYGYLRRREVSWTA